MKIAHRVYTLDLPKITKACNHIESIFISIVTDIISIPNSSYSIIVLDINGSYPYVTNQWKELFKDED